MRLSEIFQEALAAQVHSNPEKTLTVIPGLVDVEDDFEVVNAPCSSCMFVMTVNTISAISGIPKNVIGDQVSIRAPGFRGHTLEEILKKIQSKSITYEGFKHRFRLGIKTYPNIDSALKAVAKGQPVMMIVNINEALGASVEEMDSFDDEYSKHKHGIVDPEKHDIKFRSVRDEYHSPLIIGYDAAHDHVIFRETRTIYGYKGFFKIEKSVLKKHPELVRKYLSVTVEDVEKTPVKKKAGQS